MVLTDECVSAFAAHCVGEFPKEACGVVIASAFVPCTNAATNPTEHFHITAQELLRHQATLGPIQAVLHSHPIKKGVTYQHPVEWPSHHDQTQWLKGAVPWGICSTDGESISELVWLDEGVIAPLEGRTFIHGVHDCYAIIRDYYRLERNVTLPYFPRQMDWWDKGQDLYRQGFGEAGFVEIPASEVVAGDVVLMTIRGEVPHHGAIVLDSGTILQHLDGRLSGKDSLTRWRRFFTHYLRYVGK